ncbi:MAG: 50S ribosomal protein L3 [Verrucomicrobiales bacterium]|nr:50S ribosomal protein L3 [Verrucomicrobiales bacterium]
MSLGLIGKKLGMTRVYDENGVSIPVTVVSVQGNTIVQVKRQDGKDGYSAVQIGFDDQKEQRVNKPLQGHFKKAGTAPKRILREFRFATDAELPAADTALGAELFSAGQFVDVIGVTRGKGFQGVVKRHGFAGQLATHGHMMHRRPGAIGCRSTPGLVWKNQKMPGHDGQVRRTTQNLKVVQARGEEGLLFIRGNLPGAQGSYLIVRPSKKKSAAAVTA